VLAHPALEVRAAGLREEATFQSPTPAQSPTAVEAPGRRIITNIHQHAEVITITITTIILRIGSFTGFPGRIAGIPYVTTGGRISPTAISGRTITAGLFSSVSADTGLLIDIDVITGIVGSHIAGMAIIPRNM